MSGSSEDQKKELIAGLASKGLDPQDFTDWLGNQKPGGTLLDNWSIEDLSKLITTYVGLYGTKVAKPVPPTPKPEETPKPQRETSRPPPEPSQKKEEKKPVESNQPKIVVSVQPREPKSEPFAAENLEPVPADPRTEDHPLDATSVACVKIIR